MRLASYFFRTAVAVLALLSIALIMLLILRKDGEARSRVWIDAPPEIVWKVLTTVDEYPSWNPFMTRVSGDFVEGQTVRIRFGQSDDAMELTAKVLTVQPQAELHWRGQVWMPGLFDGDHHITLVRDGNGTMLSQDEIFSGLLVGRLTRSVLETTRENFEAMDAALKKRAEEKAKQPR